MVLNAPILTVSYIFASILGWIYLAYFSHELNFNDLLLTIIFLVLSYELECDCRKCVFSTMTAT